MARLRHGMKATPKTIEVMTKARELLAGGWCQKTLARDKHRHSVDPHSDSAVRFCMTGAVYRAMGRADRLPMEKFNAHLSLTGDILHRFAEAAPKGFNGATAPTYYNDCGARRQADVLTVVDKAIKTAEEELNNESRDSGAEALTDIA